MDIWNMIASILSGLIICVPLVIKLVQITKESVRKGNWNKLVGMVAEFMAQAEVKIEDNVTRKEWVLGMIRTSAEQINYDLTELELEKISAMIDDLCRMARIVNNNSTVKDGKA